MRILCLFFCILISSLAIATESRLETSAVLPPGTNGIARQDEMFVPNRDFHEHLERLKIPHTWTVLPGVDHNPMKTLEALGDSNWTF